MQTRSGTLCCLESGIGNKYMTCLKLTISIQILQLYFTALVKAVNFLFIYFLFIYFFEEEAYLCVAFPE